MSSRRRSRSPDGEEPAALQASKDEGPDDFDAHYDEIMMSNFGQRDNKRQRAENTEDHAFSCVNSEHQLAGDDMDVSSLFRCPMCGAGHWWYDPSRLSVCCSLYGENRCEFSLSVAFTGRRLEDVVRIVRSASARHHYDRCSVRLEVRRPGNPTGLAQLLKEVHTNNLECESVAHMLVADPLQSLLRGSLSPRADEEPLPSFLFVVCEQCGVDELLV